MSRDTGSGAEFSELVARYIAVNWGDAMGIDVYTEQPLGTTLMGKARRVDVLVVSRLSTAALAIECKAQSVQGTAEEKVFYALEDCQAVPIPCCLVWSGAGWSEGAIRALQRHAHAVRCEVHYDLQRSAKTLELDMRLASAFGGWPAVLGEHGRVEVFDNSWGAVMR